jgi:hypothetical protein
MLKNILPYDEMFPQCLSEYVEQIKEAISKKQHHDHRRHLFLNFLRLGFGIDPVEIELEKKLKVAQVRGNIDAFFKSTIFEFKTNLEAEKPAAMIELKKYFDSQSNPSDYLALLTDGLFFEVYQYENKQLAHIGDFELSTSDPLASFRYLDQFIFVSKPIKPNSDDIIQRFGLHSSVFNTSRLLLEAMFHQVKNEPQVKVKMKEWRTLLARVYGSHLGDDSLFTRHTYLALFSRLLVARTLFPDEIRTSKDYQGLITGDYFSRKNLPNLVELDFFSWALDTDQADNFIGFLSKLEGYLTIYNLKDIQEDLLKELYQELVDPESRHSLGEYYTPDWLAELTLDTICYEGGRLLDPSCGSGTFLFQAVKHKRSQGLTGKKLLEESLSSIIGIDVHPLAVMMSKANMLLALSKEIKAYKKEVYFQIYLSDTLLTSRDIKTRCINIPVSKSEVFLIPLQTIEREKNREISLDMTIDKLSSFAHQVAGGIDFSDAFKGFKNTVLSGFSDREIDFWRHNLKLLSNLIEKKRNSIWPFILKNAYRPVYLSLDKVDYVIGNPPWLAYRYIKDDSYKARVKELTFELGLLEKKDVKLFTQMDTSTVFFRYCQREFLKEKGSIAFVMPKTTILPSKQHIPFQRMGVSEILDFSDITPLFNVRSVVLIHRYNKSLTAKIPITYYAATFSRKNIELKNAEKHINYQRDTHTFLESEQRSPYYNLFLQGATLVLRCFWFVQPSSGAAENEDIPYLETSEEAKAEAKKPEELQGRIEREFLFETVLAKGLLPFAIFRRELLFLPLRLIDKKTILFDASGLLREGKEHAAQWVHETEKLWEKESTNEKMSIYRRLDYNGLLTMQNLNAKWVVLYNTSGTNLTAALLEPTDELHSINVNGFIADHKTYYFYPGSKEEGDYLCSMLNSKVVNDRIKAYQPQGLYGPRDIHRRPFEICPIPLFDGKDPQHVKLAELGRECRKLLKGLVPKMDGRLGTMRKDARRVIANQLSQIDRIVTELLKKHGQDKSPTLKKHKDTNPTLFNFN